MKLSQYSDQDIHELIKAMQNGIAIKPNSEESKSLEISIARAYAELERRAQKKSEELTGNPGQLTETEKIKRAVLNPSNGIPALNETPEKLKADAEKQENEPKRFEFTPTGQTTYIGSAAVLSAPTKATERTIPVLLLGWEEPKEMNRAQIRAEARRYFNAVFASAKFKTAYSEGNLSALWSMKMYCNLWALCEAYNQLTNVQFEMIELLQNYWSYSRENRDIANDLAEFLRQSQPK